jgi:hypothetical protein
MMAIENPKAMIINNVLIFLLETFLTALAKVPNDSHPHIYRI